MIIADKTEKHCFIDCGIENCSCKNRTLNNKYSEIYDQAEFFASIWEQLPEEFKIKHDGENSPTTSHRLVIWDCSAEIDDNIKCDNVL